MSKPVVKLFKTVNCGLCPQARKMLEQIRPQLEAKYEIKIFDVGMRDGRDEATKVGLLMVPAFAVDDKLISRGIPPNPTELLKRIKDVS